MHGFRIDDDWGWLGLLGLRNGLLRDWLRNLLGLQRLRGGLLLGLDYLLLGEMLDRIDRWHSGGYAGNLLHDRWVLRRDSTN